MVILTPSDWKDYELIDSGDGQRLERFGLYTLVRPDPQCIWQPTLSKVKWDKADAIFQRTSSDEQSSSANEQSFPSTNVERKGIWKKQSKIPEKWLCKWNNLSFWVKLSPFKHTGVFPEQSIHWGFISRAIANESQANILNLFGYTGIASLAAASAGAKVTHIDASYPTIGWARENQLASGLPDKPIRWILDDAMKFCQREVKRGVKYDGIIMDPPVYGHGPKGETWDFDKSFPQLMELCKNILSDKPLFLIVNAYAISASSIMLENVLNDYLKPLGGQISAGELALKENSGRLLSTGIFARWSS